MHAATIAQRVARDTITAMNYGVDFYLVKLHTNPRGWRLTFCERVDFNRATYWHLLRVTWQRKDGLEIGWNEK